MRFQEVICIFQVDVRGSTCRVSFVFSVFQDLPRCNQFRCPLGFKFIELRGKLSILG